MEASDFYQTLKKPSEEVLFKEKQSKFFSQAFPIVTKHDVKPILENLHKQHPQANHICYAWQLGIETIMYRTNDNGEPNNSAGMPIYGQLQAFGITNALITVTRIFGGTKLGVGGLIAAYRNAAKMALETSQIVKKPIEYHFKIFFGYTEMDSVMRLVRQHGIYIRKQKMELKCEFEISVLKSASETVFDFFASHPKIDIRKLI